MGGVNQSLKQRVPGDPQNSDIVITNLKKKVYLTSDTGTDFVQLIIHTSDNNARLPVLIC